MTNDGLLEKSKKFISIVVYFKNDLEDLLAFLIKIEPLFFGNFENFEIIIVNNGSSYNLRTYVENNFENGLRGDLSIINLSWSHNIEDAMRAGIELSIGDLVYEFDSTCMDFEETLILDVYRDCINGYDIVSVAPAQSGNRLSELFYKILSIFSGDLKLTSESFRIVSRRLLNISSKTKEVFSYRKANYHFAGLDSKFVDYIPLKGTKRKKEPSIMSRVALASNILIYYSSFGTRISLFLSLSFLFVSIIVGVFAIISYVTNKSIQEGWTSIVLFLSLSFCGVFGILALISKYMEVLLKESKSMSPYNYKSIDKINAKIRTVEMDASNN